MMEVTSVSDHIVDALRAKGFCVFEATGPDDKKNDFTLESLDEFTTCASELGMRVIFMETQELDEDEFFYEDGFIGVSGDDDDDDDGSIGVDLRSIDGKLRRFEQYIGQCLMVRLTGCFGGASISFFQPAEWLASFEEMRDRARHKAQESSQEAEERLEEERRKNVERLLAMISQLSNSDGFKDAFSSGRPTQGAIVAYIRTTIEGAEELPSGVLRTAANQLRDRLLLKR
ncbi:MAG TPA: hypothetical protein VMA98_06295 [Candidatus Acidoferrales bacterium]|nr:hypothetical protein [Candidatus Acidoferrales bacterium]